MKLKTFKAIIAESVRKVIKEELAKVKDEIVESIKKEGLMVEEKSTDQKIDEALNGLNLEFTNSTFDPTPQNNTTFSKNSTLNKVLNETANSGEWRTMGKELTAADAVGFNMMPKPGAPKVNVPTTDIDNKPIKQTKEVKGVLKALNKDYSAILKGAKEKSKARHGG